MGTMQRLWMLCPFVPGLSRLCYSCASGTTLQGLSPTREPDWKAVAEIHLSRWNICEVAMIDARLERDDLAEKLRCSENARYNAEGRVKELEAGTTGPAVSLAHYDLKQRECNAALARAEAAEGMILAIESNAGFYQELADKWKERARAAETRLAERDASFKRLRLCP